MRHGHIAASTCLCFSLALAACATRYEQDAPAPVVEPLTRADRIAVAVPDDAVYGSATYAGSGAMTAAVVRAAFLERAAVADLVEGCDGRDCLAAAASGGYDFLVVPTILHWEDRATEWSGISDKVGLRIDVLATADGREVSSHAFRGASSHWTFGGDHPQDLLREPVSAHVGMLYF